MFQTGKLTNRLLPLAILLLAFAMRLVAIDRIPPGLSHDEAYNGITAIQVLEGQRQIFFEINKGIEPLIIYLEALAFYAFGIGPVPLRLVNVFCGLLTIALVYPLAARLFNRRVALLAMTGLAISFWAIFVSRLTLRAITLPPLLILTIYFLWRGLTSSAHHSLLPFGPSASTHFFILSGITAGASMYTYLSSRFVPVLVIAVFGYLLLRGQIRPQHWAGLLIHFIIWAALFAPLAAYYLQHADSFTERYNQVSTIPYLLNGELEPLIRNTLRTLGMFTFYGDETDRYNLDGRPLFDWLNGLLFYTGLGMSLLRLRRSAGVAGPAMVLLIWLFFMLLPDFITDDSPHFLRTIGAMPAVYILWALGLEWVSQRLGQRRWFARARFAPRPSLLLPLLILLMALHTAYDYFGRWAWAPEARYIYGADIAEVAGHLKTAPSQGLTAVISAEYYRDLDPFRLALHFQGHPPFVIWFDGRQTLAFPPAGSGLSPPYIFAASAPPAPDWLPFLQPSPAESGQEYTLYRLPDGTAPQQLLNKLLPLENARSGININNDLVLSGYQVLGSVVSGGKFQVMLGWQALRQLPPGTDYTFLVRLRDHQGHLWAEADGNGYSPADWQPGVQALQLLTLRLPGDLPARTYQLSLQVIDRRKSQPLPATTGETVFPLATLTGRLAGTPRLIEVEKLPNPIANLPPPAAALANKTGLALRGYQIDKGVVRAGDTLSLTLHWQVLKQPPQNYQLLFFLVNGQGDAMVAHQWPAVEPIGGEWPTSQWPAGYWVQDKVDLPVGPDIPAGQFKVWLALSRATIEQRSSLNPDKMSGGFELGALAIKPGP